MLWLWCRAPYLSPQVGVHENFQIPPNWPNCPLSEQNFLIFPGQLVAWSTQYRNAVKCLPRVAITCPTTVDASPELRPKILPELERRRRYLIIVNQHDADANMKMHVNS